MQMTNEEAKQPCYSTFNEIAFIIKPNGKMIAFSITATNFHDANKIGMLKMKFS